MWYRAEIKGAGYYFESGVFITERKTVVYEFEAENNEEAIEKAGRYAHSSEMRKEFWMTDPNPEVTVMQTVSSDDRLPKEERVYLLP